jgi:N-acetyl-alpha-D-glucosaminyl L-malate synthase BshA
MRIGITCYPSVGGSGVVATELGISLARRGHKVHFITYDVPFRLEGGYQPGITHHQVDVPNYPLFRYPPYLLALTNKMVEVARFCHLDLLHVHYAIPHATSAVLARQVLGGGRPRVVTTLHGTDVSLLGSDPGFAEVLTWSINQSDGVTAVSHALARQTVEALPVRREIEVIHNFVDPAVYYRRPCQSLLADIGCGELLVGHMSNFRAVKRPQDVVLTFAMICREVPAQLVLIGDGPELPHVRELAESHGVGSRVHYLGRQDSVAEVLSCLDLFLLPSEQESFGLAALEAMACGTPVLAYGVGGLGEVITDGEGGFLLPYRDAAGMARQAVTLLRDRDLWRKVSEAGVRRAAASFATERVVPQYEAYYARVLEGAGWR